MSLKVKVDTLKVRWAGPGHERRPALVEELRDSCFRHQLTAVNETWKRILELVARGELLISEHGHDELSDDEIRVRDIVAGVPGAEVLEDYPTYPKGPCVLVLERDRDGRPLHAVWGIPRGAESPAVLVTAYRPDTARWSEDFRRRLP